MHLRSDHNDITIKLHFSSSYFKFTKMDYVSSFGSVCLYKVKNKKYYLKYKFFGEIKLKNIVY